MTIVRQETRKHASIYELAKEMKASMKWNLRMSDYGFTINGIGHDPHNITAIALHIKYLCKDQYL